MVSRKLLVAARGFAIACGVVIGGAHASPAGPSETTTVPETRPRLMIFSVQSPTNVRSVAAGTDCGAHVGTIGALFCPDMMKSGDLLLIWDWQAGAGVDTIDGYHIYRIGRGAGTARLSTELIATQTNRLQTLFDIPKPSDGSGYAGKCYAVTAFSGAKESDHSAPFCAAGTSSAKTVTFAPVSELSITQWHNNGREQPVRIESQRGVRVVGYVYAASDNGIRRDTWQAFNSRYAVRFDVSALAGHQIVAARIILKVQPGIADSRPDCANSVGYGDSDWFNDQSWPDATFSGGPSVSLPDRTEIEATNAVINWASGRFNDGFVLRNDDENLNAFTTKRCETFYAPNPILSVTYY